MMHTQVTGYRVSMTTFSTVDSPTSVDTFGVNRHALVGKVSSFQVEQLACLPLHER